VLVTPHAHGVHEPNQGGSPMSPVVRFHEVLRERAE